MEQIAAMGIQGPNMNPQVGSGSTSCSLQIEQARLIPSHLHLSPLQALSADFLKLMQSMDPK